MSGTSLDGVDVAFCHFKLKKKRWHFSIEAAQTFTYPDKWKNSLASAHLLSGEKLMELHTAYGKYLGELCNRFLQKNSLSKKIDMIASHGHTIFHQPENKFTFQLGDGNALHAITQLPVIFDFRSLDIALGGEGAPLVPIGDQILFSEYDVCLNLGGIANLSIEKNGRRKAYDVCFCNMALNYLSVKAGKNFDENGKLSSRGSVRAKLLNQLEGFYSSFRKNKPSLGRERFEKDLQSLLDNESITINDRLRTMCESVANEIAMAIPLSKEKMKLLATGGGALNDFLINLIQEKLSKRTKLIVPDKTIVNFKEALVFAFLGVLRLRNEVNVLKSVTGAERDSSSGVLIG